jgi:murein DD-endopeptidase MepM/ murein hydrolase activator NlpD
LAGFLALVAVALLGGSGLWRDASTSWLQVAPPAQAAVPETPPLPPQRFETLVGRLGRGRTLAHGLLDMGLGGPEVTEVVGALTSIFPFNRARMGDQIRVIRAGDGRLERVAYRQGATDEWLAQRLPDGTLYGEKRLVELRTEMARVKVDITSSLYESLQTAGEDPVLAVAASDVLAWDVDFYQDVRNGDAMTLLVEKIFADGRLVRYGEVLAARYRGETVGEKRLFRYTDPNGQTSYYGEDGESARRGFLKSPLKYSSITSRYGSRRHPVLQYVRAHQGVDYGAPTGTPIWAVGDGTVTQAGWNGGCGRSVTLRHRNGLSTLYCHLSGLASAIQTGARVVQKQVIGFVGATGLATGPHLHYAIMRNGQYMNPLSLQLPREAPVAAEHREDFDRQIAPLVSQLDAEPVALR